MEGAEHLIHGQPLKVREVHEWEREGSQHYTSTTTQQQQNNNNMI
jgi:hypothetical protein